MASELATPLASPARCKSPAMRASTATRFAASSTAPAAREASRRLARAACGDIAPDIEPLFGAVSGRSPGRVEVIQGPPRSGPGAGRTPGHRPECRSPRGSRPRQRPCARGADLAPRARCGPVRLGPKALRGPAFAVRRTAATAFPGSTGSWADPCAADAHPGRGRRYPRRCTSNASNRAKSLSFVRILSMPCSRHTAAICASNIRLPCESASRAVASSRCRNSAPGCTTSQLGAAVTDSMNSAACDDSRRRVEHPPVRHHPHELRHAEHRKRPSFHTFAQGDEPRCRRLVQLALGPMRVNQDVRVEGYHGRSITS